MRIRSLVPALACLAAAPLAIAADGPSVKFDGFVDTVYSITNNEHGGGSTGFNYAGKLGVSAAISDKVSAQVDLNIDVDGSTGVNDNGVTSRQAYGVWKVIDGVELKTGKFISDYGWTAAYAPGLYRINGGLLPTLYGVDQVGVNAKYSMGDLAVALTVANGFFGEGVGAGNQDGTQDNEAYAVGLDVVYTLGEMGSVNLELINDSDVGDGEDGNGTHIGVNATLTPTKELTVGAEIISQTVNNTDGGKDDQATGAMVLANFKLATAMPMSVTGQYSFLDQDSGSTSDTVKNELAVALLTNPAGTDKLGANLELSYTTVETDSEDTEYSIGLAGEILYVF
ncbi:MAG: outer membrane beta-barrel protein [Planctomycetes bacterium]|nr:outer membrane beta-barrel protein [Planctomycetota bacterium]